MTTMGRLVFGTYSFIAVTILLVLNIKKIAKGDTNGWELVALIPVMIFLVNVI